jgi:hypothetical protein
MRDISQRHTSFAQTITNGFSGESGIVLFAREALFLRGGDDLPSTTSAAALSW